MIYQFRCKEHGEFEVNQPMLSEHKTDCPECSEPCQRVYSPLKHIWADSVFRPDGSFREDKDYAILKG